MLTFMNTGSQPWAPDRLTTLKAIGGAFANLWRARFWVNISSQVSTSFDMPVNLIGINVASQKARACDDYVIEHVRFLGLRCVRMGLSYAGLGQHPERLLKRLIDEGYALAGKILADKPEEFERLAQGLLEYETLTGEEIERVMRGELPHVDDDEDDSPDEGNAPSVTSIPKTKPKKP